MEIIMKKVRTYFDLMLILSIFPSTGQRECVEIESVLLEIVVGLRRREEKAEKFPTYGYLKYTRFLEVSIFRY